MSFNLNEETFFADLRRICPKAVIVFFDWYAEYNQKVDLAKNIIFEDLPLEFQNGILSRFYMECVRKAPYEATEWFVPQLREIFLAFEDDLNYEPNLNIPLLELKGPGGEVVVSCPFLQFRLSEEQQVACIGIDFDQYDQRLQFGDDQVDAMPMGKLGNQSAIFKAQLMNTLKKEGWNIKEYPNPEIVILTKKEKKSNLIISPE